MKIATWNINSVRLRAGLVQRFLAEEQPDILCLQETKTPDSNFPLEELKSSGYPHIYFSGEKSYNGVAIISKIALQNINNLNLVNNDKRHISGTLPDGTKLHNFYVPAGGDEPDPKTNPKFRHKLEYVDEMAEFFCTQRKNADKIIIVGDFNIAPLENDVWSHKQLLKVVSHTPVEVEKLDNLRDTLGWTDSTRHFTPHEEKLYSWWSYRSRDWRKSDRGRRLDHIWVTPPLKNSLHSGYILKDWRSAEKPSDHVPVVVEVASF